MKNNHMFVAAGVQTCLNYFIKVFKGKPLDKFIELVCPKGLVSFGITLNKKNRDKFDKKRHIKSILGQLTDYPEVRHIMDMFLDSGGFQVTCGLVPKKHIGKFTEAYVEFLNDYTDFYDFAFSLDIPVLPDITNRQEMYELNKTSYNIIDNLNDNIKERLIFVSHFRLKELYEIWNKLIFEDGIIKKYSRYSIGGLVASQPAAKKLQYNLYTLGFLQIIFGLEKKLPNHFHLHILGSATGHSVLYFTLIEEFLRRKFRINPIVTFDSSAVFTKVQVARCFTYFDGENCWLIDLKSSELDKKHKCGLTPREIVYNITKRISKECGTYFPDEDIYSEKTGTFTDQFRPYILALESYTLNRISDYCREISKDLIDLYYNDDMLFFKTLEDIFVRFNNGKVSDVSRSKCTSIINSLSTLEDFIDNKNVSDLLKYFDNIGYVLDTEQTNDLTSQFQVL